MVVKVGNTTVSDATYQYATLKLEKSEGAKTTKSGIAGPEKPISQR